jgi:lipopolysaccharide/colanic/teichoic acid biosynthesis glycosyltransferase
MIADAEQYLSSLRALNEREGPVFKIANDPRTTRVGKFLRKTCLDEFPQLINVLLGDMSLVGPRPPLPDEARQYSPYQTRRLSVKPGLTCFWQLKREKAATFDDWVEMDLDYIAKRTFFLDLKLIFTTVAFIFRGMGHL